MRTSRKPAGQTNAESPNDPSIATAVLQPKPGSSVLGVALRRLASPRYSAIYLAALFIIIYSFLLPGQFLSAVNLRLVATSGVVTCTLALGFLIPLSANQYDLSIGSVMALSLVLINWMTLHTGLPLLLILVVALVASAVSGAVAGFLVVKLNINSFIATLGISTVLAALVLLISANSGVYGNFGPLASKFGNANLVGVPVLLIYLLVLAIVVWFVLEQTSFGRQVFATGGSYNAAKLAGVPTDRIIWSSLVISGTISGFAGVLFALQVGAFSSSVGPGYLFPAVTAVFLGASQFAGRPGVPGTLVAYYALALGLSGLNLKYAGQSYWMDSLFQGIALILAVALAQYKRRTKLNPSNAQEVLVSDEPALT